MEDSKGIPPPEEGDAEETRAPFRRSPLGV